MRQKSGNFHTTGHKFGEKFLSLVLAVLLLAGSMPVYATEPSVEVCSCELLCTEGTPACPVCEGDISACTGKEAPEVPATSETPVAEPSLEPSPGVEPSLEPTPTEAPTAEPTAQPTIAPTVEPTIVPTVEPTIEPEATVKPSPAVQLSPAPRTALTAPQAGEATCSYTTNGGGNWVSGVSFSEAITQINASSGDNTIQVKSSGSTGTFGDSHTSYTLDLCGSELTLNSSLVSIGSASLTITDTSSGEGKIIGAGKQISLYTGSFTLVRGILDFSVSPANPSVRSYGSIDIRGGNLLLNNATANPFRADGNVSMSGGRIELSGTTDLQGLVSYQTFTMSGGEIFSTIPSNSIGSNGTFVMTGGTIHGTCGNAIPVAIMRATTDNSISGSASITCTGGSSGVVVTSGAGLTISGGTISGSGANTNCYGVKNYGNVFLSGNPKISGAAGDIYLQDKAKLTASNAGVNYSGDPISIYYSEKQISAGKRLIQGVADASVAAKFSCINSGFGTSYDEITQEITAKEIVVPNITVDGADIRANGNALLIMEGIIRDTTIFIDVNRNGSLDPGELSLEEANVPGAPQNNADLSACCIYGGGGATALTGNTLITMNGGMVDSIYGGGERAVTTGNTQVAINGGTVTSDVFGGSNYGNISGNTSITMTGGTVGRNLYAGNANTAVVSGSTSLTLGGSAKIGNGIDNCGIVINGGYGDELQGVTSFAIAPDFEADANVAVLLPAGYDLGGNPTIATGAVQDDLTKLKLMGSSAAGVTAYLNGTDIKVGKTYTATFALNGGTGTAPAPFTGIAGNPVAKPADPSKAYYTFAGWYTEAAGTTPWNFAADKLTKDITLYAKWRGVPITVTYNYQGADGGNTDSSKTAYYNEAFGALPTPTRTNYDFLGWFIQQAGGNAVTPETINTHVNNITIYAQWKNRDIEKPAAPVLQTGATIPDSWTNSFTEIPLTLKDNKGVTELWVQVDGNSFVKLSSFTGGESYAYKILEGSHDYVFYAKDANGNQSENSATFTVMLDTTAAVLRAGETKGIGSDKATIVFQSNKAGSYYLLLDPNTIPDAETVAKSTITGAAADGWGQIPLTGLSSGAEHNTYLVVKDRAGNLSAVVNISFATIPTVPPATEAVIDYKNETLSFNAKYEMNSDSSFTGSPITGGNITPNTVIFIRVKASGAIPASGATAVSLPARPASPSGKDVTATTSSLQIVPVLPGEEYSIDNWTTCNTTGLFENLIPGTAYTLSCRKAATDTSFKSLSSSLDAKTKIAISVPTGSEIGKGSASADITTAVVGDTVTYRVNFEVGYTPTFTLTGNNGNLSAPTKGTSQWLYTYVIAENDTTVSAAVTFAARAAVSLVPPTAPAPIFADNAANKSESALSAWLGTQAKPTATYDNDTTQKVTATYTLKNESTFNAKGGSYSFTANAEGRTCDLSLTVKPVTAAVTAPANISLEERKSGYTQEQLGLPNSTTLTYSGDGYTEKSDTTNITWQDAGLGADFGKSPSKGNVFSGTALLPSWATGNNKVSLDVDITPAYLTDLAITHAPGKTTYRQDELFDKTGMVVEATYSDKTKKTVTGYTFTPSGALKGTDTKVVVRYTSDGITKTADQAITVLVPFIVNFDADGGQGQFPNQSLCLGDKVTKPADPTKSGYTFKGWFVGNSAFDFTSTVTGPITLKAKWVDKTAPTSVAAFYEKDGNWVSFGTGSTLNLLFDHSVSVKLTAEDSGTGVKSFTYTLGDKVQTIDAAGDEAIISIATPYIGNLSVTAADAAGNQSTPTATEYFAVDGENPAALTVETNGYTPGDWTNKDITLTLSGATAVSGIAGYDFSTDDGKTWTAMAVTDKSEATATTPATVNKGEVTITTDTDTSYLFRAVSNVHLISDSSAPLSVKRDTVVPDGDISYNENSVKQFINSITFGLFFNKTVDVEITGTDNLSGIDEIAYYQSATVLDQSGVEAIQAWIPGEKFSVAAKDKDQFVTYVRIADKAGNITMFGSDGAVFDTVAPEISGVLGTLIYYTTQQAVITDTNLRGITLNGQRAATPLSLPGNLDMSYVISAADAAGNQTALTVTMKPISDISAKIDKLTEKTVTSADSAAIAEALSVVGTLDLTNATQGEKDTLQAITDKGTALLKKIDTAAKAATPASYDHVKDIHTDNVKLADKDSLADAKSQLEKALTDYSDNYTEAEKATVGKKLETVEKALETIAAVEGVIEKIEKLPSAEQVKPGDTQSIQEAKKLYDSLSDHQKSLLPSDVTAKLDKTATALANLRLKDDDTGTTVEAVGDTVLDPNLQLVVTPINPSDKQTTSIQAVANGQNLVSLFDISLLLNGVKIQPTGKVKVTLSLTDEQMKNYKDFQIVYIDDDGKSVILPSIVSGNKISFETDLFSSFAIIATRINQVPDNVQTGDNSPIPFLLWIVALSAGILLLLMGKIRKSISQK